MWIETFYFRKITTQTDFISAPAEMWIETASARNEKLHRIEFHLCSGRDVDWNDFRSRLKIFRCDFISAPAEMWIETRDKDCIKPFAFISSLLRQRCGLKPSSGLSELVWIDFISAPAEMWIETETTVKRAVNDRFHLCSGRDVDWNYKSEMVNDNQVKFHLCSGRDVDWNTS